MADTASPSAVLDARHPDNAEQTSVAVMTALEVLKATVAGLRVDVDHLTTQKAARTEIDLLANAVGMHTTRLQKLEEAQGVTKQIVGGIVDAMNAQTEPNLAEMMDTLNAHLDVIAPDWKRRPSARG